MLADAVISDESFQSRYSNNYPGQTVVLKEPYDRTAHTRTDSLAGKWKTVALSAMTAFVDDTFVVAASSVAKAVAATFEIVRTVDDAFGDEDSAAVASFGNVALVGATSAEEQIVAGEFEGARIAAASYGTVSRAAASCVASLGAATSVAAESDDDVVSDSAPTVPASSDSAAAVDASGSAATFARHRTATESAGESAATVA